MEKDMPCTESPKVAMQVSDKISDKNVTRDKKGHFIISHASYMSNKSHKIHEEKIDMKQNLTNIWNKNWQMYYATISSWEIYLPCFQ